VHKIPDKPLSPAEEASIDEARSTRRSTAIAAFSALVSVVAIGAAVGIGLYSAHLVEQQNTNAQQQELVSLVTDIAQQPASTSSTVVNPELATLGEGEEADSIIKDLPPADVSSVEKYIVAVALEQGQDYELALQLFTSAALEASDPRTESDAWREAASALYTLQLNSQAEYDINLAKKSYNGPGVTAFSRENNTAFTDLFDVQYRASIDCSSALNEWDAAAGFIQAYPNTFTGVDNAIAAETNGREALVSICKVPLDTLKVISISQ
jgi:hypothetical protein